MISNRITISIGECNIITIFGQNLPQFQSIGIITKRQRNACHPCPACAPDTVRVSILAFRHIIIDNMANRWNINAARRHICSNQDVDLTCPELIQNFAAQKLPHIPMQSIDLHANLRQVCRQCISAAFGADKNNARLNGFLIEDIYQKSAFLLFRHKVHMLRDMMRFG